MKSSWQKKRTILTNLVLLAPIDGFIYQRNLANRLGEHVKQGDILLTVARDDQQKIVVSIDQEDLESLKANNENPMRVLLPGKRVFQARINSVGERASDQSET